MKNPDSYSTADIPEEYDEKDDTSQIEFFGGGTIPHAMGQSETVPPSLEAEQEDSISKLVQTPLPSIPLEKIRGQTITKWAIERRRTAKSLSDIWNKASQRITDSAFAVYVDQLVSEIDQKIPLFRDIPYEDAFSGILQLVRDAITGPNLSRLQNKRLESIIDKVFEMLVSREKLSLLEHKNIHKLLAEKQLLRN